MADPVTMALMAGGSLIKGIGSFVGGRSLAQANKRAGTTLADMAQLEQERALAFPDTINPYIEQRYGQAIGSVGDVANRSADALQQTARGGYEDVMGQAREANAYLNPYSAAGGQSLSTLSQLANAPEERFSGAGPLEMDPGYQFRLAEGTSALQKSAAMRGGLQGGGTLKALTKYSQDAASQEYQNAFNRSLATFGANQSARQQRLGSLSSLASMGYGAAGQAGQNMMGAAQYGAGLTTGAAGTAGGMRNAASQWGGDALLNSTNMQTGNIVNANNVSRDLRLQGGQATANSILGTGQAGANMWTGLGNAIGGGMQATAAMMANPYGGGATPGSYPGLGTGGGGYNMPSKPWWMQ